MLCVAKIELIHVRYVVQEAGNHHKDFLEPREDLVELVLTKG